MGGTGTGHLTFSASVWIRSGPEHVFALISDPPRKAALNPNVQVIRVEMEGQGPVRAGSVFYHRLQKGQRIFEYRSRCVRMVPPLLFESRAETEPPFEVTVTVQPGDAGCWLTQQEKFEATPELLDALEPPWPAGGTFRDLPGFLTFVPGGRQLGVELRAHQRDRVARKLTGELQAWLEALKAHLEARGSPGEGRAPWS